MRVLLTAFDPFGKEKINPALEVCKKVKIDHENVELFKLEIPTVFNKSVKKVVGKIEEIKPDLIFLLGQAGGRSKVSLERIAINIDNASIKDNEGNMPKNLKQRENGPDGIFSSLDIEDLVFELKKEGIPAEISNSAGTFVCNHLMYGTLLYIKENKLDIKGGFIHLPFLPEQVLDKGNLPYMPLEMMIRAIEIIINKQIDLCWEGNNND